MQSIIVSIKNPKWANESHTAIDCELMLEGLDDVLPFTASSDDCEPHGKEIFGRILAGEFGEISDFVA